MLYVNHVSALNPVLKIDNEIETKWGSRYRTNKARLNSGRMRKLLLEYPESFLTRRLKSSGLVDDFSRQCDLSIFFKCIQTKVYNQDKNLKTSDGGESINWESDVRKLRHSGIKSRSVERAFNVSDASGIKRLTNCQVYITCGGMMYVVRRAVD